jgi:hypothetical protein
MVDQHHFVRAARVSLDPYRAGATEQVEKARAA